MQDPMLQKYAKPSDNWRRYAALEIVRQAVVQLRRHGDIFGDTTEKMKDLFPEIKTGWE